MPRDRQNRKPSRARRCCLRRVPFVTGCRCNQRYRNGFATGPQIRIRERGSSPHPFSLNTSCPHFRRGDVRLGSPTGSSAVGQSLAVQSSTNTRFPDDSAPYLYTGREANDRLGIAISRPIRHLRQGEGCEDVSPAETLGALAYA